jgi:hypothetical protein
MALKDLADATLGWVVENSLIFIVRIKIPNPIESMIQASSLIEQLFEGYHSDVCLQFPGTCLELNAHKAILSVASPVFRAMFDCAGPESGNEVMLLANEEHKTMKQLLRCIYLGICDDEAYLTNITRATELFKLSCRYEVVNVIQTSEKTLISLLSRDNVLDLLILADSLDGSKRLKPACIEFAVKNCTEIFHQMQYSFQSFGGQASAVSSQIPSEDGEPARKRTKIGYLQLSII